MDSLAKQVAAAFDVPPEMAPCVCDQCIADIWYPVWLQLDAAVRAVRRQ